MGGREKGERERERDEGRRRQQEESSQLCSLQLHDLHTLLSVILLFRSFTILTVVAGRLPGLLPRTSAAVDRARP